MAPKTNGHDTHKCKFCPIVDGKHKEMRSDNYAGHMRRMHVRDILMKDNEQLETSITNNDVVIYHNTSVKGQQKTTHHYSFAICLGCGDHTSAVGKSTMRGIRYEYPEDYLMHKMYESPCEVEEWIAKHNRMCKGRYDHIKDWFDLNVRKPAAIPERPKSGITREYVPRGTKTTKADVGVSDRAICDEIVKRFGDVFEYYNYDSAEEEIDEEDEDAVEERKEHREDRARERGMTYIEMIDRIRKSYDYQIKEARKKRVPQNNDAERQRLLEQNQTLKDENEKLKSQLEALTAKAILDRFD